MAAAATVDPRASAHEALSYYLIETDPEEFRLQHMVDAFAAETADSGTKPIRLVFALVGLHLKIERGFSGTEIQRAHSQLANSGATWPRLTLPAERGDIGIEDVMAAEPGHERDAMLDRWCHSVWQAYGEHHALIRAIASQLTGRVQAHKGTT